MLRHPILINRPIVVPHALGTKLCRPSEAVLELLPAAERSRPFAKEDGEVVEDSGRRRARGDPG